MIFVTLGTQDKSFVRLLTAVDKQIKLGNIKEEVIAQIGHTSYKSKNMKLFDYLSNDEFEKIMDKCRILITHGGVGSIIDGLKREKTIIAAPRLAKYKEHTNDHQIQIINEFSKRGHILPLMSFNDLDQVLKEARSFKPKPYISNTENMINLIKGYIDKN